MAEMDEALNYGSSDLKSNMPTTTPPSCERQLMSAGIFKKKKTSSTEVLCDLQENLLLYFVLRFIHERTQD